MTLKFISSLTKNKACTSLILLSLLFGCAPHCAKIEPEISYTPSTRLIQALPSPFEKLSKVELQQEWGRHFFIGLNFANEMDLYRAITEFKTALIFVSKKNEERRLQIEYCLFLCYYLGQKYGEAVEIFTTTSLSRVDESFPAYEELMIMLYDSYRNTGQIENQNWIYKNIEEYDPELAANLALSANLQDGNIDAAKAMVEAEPKWEPIKTYLGQYEGATKSVKAAQTLNAILPGAGYYYLGQKKTALTSFIINALFIGATYFFMKEGNIPAGLVTASLESGWYVGGINGAGLSAREYNEHLYEVNTKEVLLRNQLFPILMLKKTF